MKYKLLLLSIGMATLWGGCKKDNKEEPNSLLSGTVVIAGTKQAVGVATNGTQLELWQDGYQLRSKIAVHIDQNGTFSARLFDGTYKLVRLTGSPWANNTDTIVVNLKGPTTIDVPVDPFFTIGGETFTFNKSDTSVTSVFSVNRLDAGKVSDRIALHIGLTNFTDVNNQIPFSPATINDIVPPATYLTTPTTIKVYLNPARHPDYKDAQGRDVSNAELRRQLDYSLTKGYVFVRTSVKTTGITQRFYTQVKQLSVR